MARSPYLLVALWLVAAVGCGDFVIYEETTGTAPDAGLPRPLDPPAGLRRQERVDHSDWNELLRDIVQPGAGADDGARVDYASLLEDEAARQRLSDYLERIGELDATALADGDERVVLYVNAYNAGVVYGVLPLLERDPGFSTADDDFAFFKQEDYVISGVRMSLDQLEHGVLRGDFARASVRGADRTTLGQIRGLHEDLSVAWRFDARIHVALNCAAISCPDLQPAAYQSDALDAQLDAASAAFLANGDKGAGPDGISSLFRSDWFAADFIESDGGVREFIARYREQGLDGVDTGRFLSYDWALNALR